MYSGDKDLRNSLDIVALDLFGDTYDKLSHHMRNAMIATFFRHLRTMKERYPTHWFVIAFRVFIKCFFKKCECDINGDTIHPHSGVLRGSMKCVRIAGC